MSIYDLDPISFQYQMQVFVVVGVAPGEIRIDGDLLARRSALRLHGATDGIQAAETIPEQGRAQTRPLAGGNCRENSWHATGRAVGVPELSLFVAVVAVMLGVGIWLNTAIFTRWGGQFCPLLTFNMNTVTVL